MSVLYATVPNLSSIWFSDNTTQKHAKAVSEQKDYDYGPLQGELRPAVNRLETQLVGSEAQGRVSASSGVMLIACTNLTRLRSISNGFGRGW